jgi:hypothetical protein
MGLAVEVSGRISILMPGGAAVDDSARGVMALPASIGGNWRSAPDSANLVGGTGLVDWRSAGWLPVEEPLGVTDASGVRNEIPTEGLRRGAAVVGDDCP